MLAAWYAVAWIRWDDAYERDELIRADWVEALEVDQVLDFDPQAVGNAAEKLNTHAHLACFYLPYMRLIAANHECELSLR